LAGRARAAVAARGVFTRAAARAGTAAGVGPNPVTTWVAAHVVLVRAFAVGAAVLALSFWDEPRPRTLLLLGILVLVAFAVIETVARAARPTDAVAAPRPAP
jgi:hypothetical protein